ncbi:MAG: M23 family metallopeptidase [bacterium]|nr:M23 family metallopeptidase [bacterium]
MLVSMFAALALALALLLGSPTPVVDYHWPTGGPAAVLRAFSPPEVPWGSGHRGVDLQLAEGSVVVAAGDGTVVYAARLAGRGVVSIEHADGLRTTYEPVEASVRRGEHVRRGDPIGVLAAGHCEGGCLHLGARRGPDSYIDPLSLFGIKRVRLLPLDGSRVDLRLADAPV